MQGRGSKFRWSPVELLATTTAVRFVSNRLIIKATRVPRDLTFGMWHIAMRNEHIGVQKR